MIKGWFLGGCLMTYFSFYCDCLGEMPTFKFLIYLYSCSIILHNGVERLNWYGTTNMNKVCGDGGSEKVILGDKRLV